MSQGIFVGTATVPAGTGDWAVTGVGFAPVALIMWVSERTATSTGVDEDVRFSIGFSDGTDDYSCGWAASDAHTTAFRATADSKILHIKNGTGATRNEGTLKTFDADGFTIDVTTANEETIVHFMAIGGAGVSAKVGTITTPGSADTSVAATGVGFKPSALFFGASIPGTLPIGANLTAACSFAAASEDTKFGIQGVSWGKINNGATDEAKSEQSNVTWDLYDAALGLTEKMFPISYDSDGFTMRHVASASSTTVIGYLALDGVQLYARHRNAKGTATTDTITFHAGITNFTPTGALMFSSGEAVGDNESAEAVFGAVDDDGNEGYMLTQSADGSPSDCGAVLKETTGEILGMCVRDVTGAPAVVDEASLSSFGDGEMVVSWDTVSGNLPVYVAVMLRAGSIGGEFVRGIVFADGWGG